MKNLIKYVQNVNSQNVLWNNGDTIVIGISGGPDSMCLLDVMFRIAKKRKLKLIIVHVNYGLRGEDSDEDASLVAETAKKHNILCETLVCAKDIAKGENQWRDIRYKFFVKIAKKYNAQSIAVAHNKNDQAETLLLHLLRGAGLNGLSGMRIKNNNIIRPLLDVKKEDILKYCSQNNIKYNIDKTNKDTKFTRNKIRNNLIPYLEEGFNENIVDILAKTATTVAQDYDLLNKTQKQFWQFDKQNKIITFSAREFLQYHESEQKTVLRSMIKQLKGDVIDIEKGFIDELIKAMTSTKNKHQKITSKDLKMHKKGDTVELVRI